MPTHHKVLITKCPLCGGLIDHSLDRGCPRTFCNNKCKQADKNLRNRLRTLEKEIKHQWRNTFIQLERINSMTMCSICLTMTENTVLDGKLDLCINCLPKVQALRKK